MVSLLCGLNASKYEQIRLATDDIKKYQIYPYYMSENIEISVRQCEKDNVSKMVIGAAFGFGILLVCAPYLAPAFAAKGLFGAAAVSNGLATVGGFSGCVIGSAMGENECFKAAIADLPEHYHDYIYYENSEVMYAGEFKGNLFHGTGSFYDSNGKVLYKGKFENGLPKYLLSRSKHQKNQPSSTVLEGV